MNVKGQPSTMTDRPEPRRAGRAHVACALALGSLIAGCLTAWSPAEAGGTTSRVVGGEQLHSEAARLFRDRRYPDAYGRFVALADAGHAASARMALFMCEQGPMPDYKAIDALTQGAVGKELFGILEKQGVVPLAWGENGFRELTNSKREVRKPDDLKGLKIRVVGSPLFLATFQALGANPTQMSWADAQPAFASGAVDGQENPMSIFTAAKLHTVGQKNVTMWGYVADPLVFVVNKEVWESWTPADRDIVRQAAIDAGKQEIAIARKGLDEAGQPLVKEIEGMGVKVTRLTPAERTEFVNATRRVYAQWKGTIGPDLVNKAEAAVAARK